MEQNLEIKRKHDSNGNILFEWSSLNGKFHGEFKTFFENGHLQQISNYKNGILGNVESWYDLNATGQLENITTTKGFVVHGPQTSFYYNDYKEHIHYYDNGNPMFNFFTLNGKRHGKSLRFYENGTISDESFFENGVKHGITTKYNENGIKTSEWPFLNGFIHGLQKHWHSNGIISMQRNKVNGLTEGYAFLWNIDESRNWIGKFQNNLASGPTITFNY